MKLRPFAFAFVFAVTLNLGAPGALPAQDTQSPVDGEAPSDTTPETDTGADSPETTEVGFQGDPTATLIALESSRQAKERELDELQTRLAASRDDREKEELGKASQELRDEIRELRRKFESISSGVDVAQFESPPSQSFDFRSEIQSLLEPLVHQLKSATEAPRVIDKLKTRVEQYTQLEGKATTAIENLEARRADAPPELAPALETALSDWTSRRDNARRERSVAQYELQEKLLARKDPIEATREFFSQFFSSRGLNLAMAIGAFLVAFLGLRFAHRAAFRPFFLRKRRSFSTRLANVLFHIFTFVAALGAMLIVLFAANDWVLMVLVLLFLFGIGWASIRTLPLILEELRLLLNLGSVREGERIIFEGMPWRVDALMIYSRLTNPELTGGMLRIPLRDLIGLHSRPLGENEAWFPCREGDWVRLADGTRGKVDLQTPDMVHLTLPGGGEKTYPTADFLSQTPQNLARRFRVEISFGVDYQHQADCTHRIPELMEKKLRKGLIEIARAEEILRLEVEFREAAASSLDYEVQGDFAGSAADRYEPIQRAMARLLVEACNENGWVIPFQQLTLHQAK